MKSSKLSELEIRKEDLKVTPREYRDMLIHDWILKPWILDDCLEVHMVRQLNTETFLKCIKHGELMLGRDFYSVIWLNSPNRLLNEGKLLLSFRFCKHMAVGYCLVKSFKNTNLKAEPKTLNLDSVQMYS